MSNPFVALSDNPNDDTRSVRADNLGRSGLLSVAAAAVIVLAVLVVCSLASVAHGRTTMTTIPTYSGCTNSPNCNTAFVISTPPSTQYLSFTITVPPEYLNTSYSLDIGLLTSTNTSAQWTSSWSSSPLDNWTARSLVEFRNVDAKGNAIYKPSKSGVEGVTIPVVFESFLKASAYAIVLNDPTGLNSLNNSLFTVAQLNPSVFKLEIVYSLTLGLVSTAVMASLLYTHGLTRLSAWALDSRWALVVVAATAAEAFVPRALAYGSVFCAYLSYIFGDLHFGVMLSFTFSFFGRLRGTSRTVTRGKFGAVAVLMLFLMSSMLVNLVRINAQPIIIGSTGFNVRSTFELLLTYSFLAWAVIEVCSGALIAFRAAASESGRPRGLVVFYFTLPYFVLYIIGHATGAVSFFPVQATSWAFFIGLKHVYAWVLVFLLW